MDQDDLLRLASVGRLDLLDGQILGGHRLSDGRAGAIELRTRGDPDLLTNLAAPDGEFRGVVLEDGSLHDAVPIDALTETRGVVVIGVLPPVRAIPASRAIVGFPEFIVLGGSTDVRPVEGRPGVQDDWLACQLLHLSAPRLDGGLVASTSSRILLGIVSVESWLVGLGPVEEYPCFTLGVCRARVHRIGVNAEWNASPIQSGRVCSEYLVGVR